MKNTISVLAIALVITGCGQPASTPDHSATGAGDTAALGTNQPAPGAKNNAQLDSIDRANEQMILASGDDITRAMVFLKDGDSTIHLTANMKRDHRIFGYIQPDIRSERLLLLSVFTNDVDQNPFGCKLGAYYDTGGMDGWVLKYISTAGNFVKVSATDKNKQLTTVYFEKKWVDIQ
jgi:hypothetical protein